MAVICLCAEDQVLFQLEALQFKQVEFQPAGSTGQLLQRRDALRCAGKRELNHSDGRLSASADLKHVLAQWMTQAIHLPILRRRLALADQVVTARRGIRDRRRRQIKRQGLVIEAGHTLQLMLRKPPEQAADPIQLDDGFLAVQAKPLDHTSIEGGKQRFLGLAHALRNLLFQITP